MKHPFKILFLADGIHPYTIGGMQKFSSELVREFLKVGCEVKLVFSVQHNSEIPSEQQVITDLGIDEGSSLLFKMKGINFPKPLKYPGHYIKESYLFSKFIYEEILDTIQYYDFIYAQGFTAWYLLEQKKKGVLMPKVGVNFHGLNMFQKSFGWRAKLVAKIFQKPVRKNLILADIVFSYGGTFNEIYKKLGVSHKIIFQPIGIEQYKIMNAKPSLHQPLRIVFIGRNDRIKGLELLHDVISDFSVNELQFTFVGNIPLGSRLKRNDCLYTGTISDSEVEKILLESDVMICPSFSEGMPYVILEAMSKGLMIVASHVGAISEMVDSTNGFLVSPGNKQELKSVLKRLCTLDEDFIRMQKNNSLIKARRFVWDGVVESTLVRLQEVIKK